jgi:hypothetical protein
LLLGKHQLEAVEIRERLSGLSVSNLLGPRGLSKESIDIVLGKETVQSGNTDSSGDLDGDVGELTTGKVDFHARNFGTLNKNSVVVNDFDDDGEFIGVFLVSDKDHTANLDKSVELFTGSGG